MALNKYISIYFYFIYSIHDATLDCRDFDSDSFLNFNFLADKCYQKGSHKHST